MSALVVAAMGIVALVGFLSASAVAATRSDMQYNAAATAKELRQASYGPSSIDCPGASVRVRRGQNIQAAIDAAPHGSTFCIEAGEYRLSETLHPKFNDVLLFEPGALLNGSRLLVDWTFDGTYWQVGGQTQSFPKLDPPCEANPVACEYEDLFRDDKPMERVLEVSKVAPGKFFFDEEAHRMFIKEDPNGHRFEATVTGTAIDTLDVGMVTIRGATIEKFAYHGIVIKLGGKVERNEIRYCHSYGLRTGLEVAVVGNKIHRNGTMGIFGTGHRSRFEQNEIAYNNTLNFGKQNDPWQAGAAKVMLSNGTIVRRNWSHNNRGDGWWFDTDNIDSLVESNLFEDNERFGLFYEISERASIRQNIAKRNGEGGIWINNSRNVDIAGNTLEFNAGYSIGLVGYDRETSPTYGEHRLANVHSHENLIRMEEGVVGTAPGDYRKVPSDSNLFEGNRYEVSDPEQKWWTWAGESRTWAEWKAGGQDRAGEVQGLGGGRGE